MSKLKAPSLRALGVAVALTVGVSAPWASASSGPRAGSKSEVAALVAASLRITTVPGSLTPSIESALEDPTSPQIDGANDILESCDPYWTHSEATAPVPCYYGDLSSKKVVVLWGDSNSGMWVPALDTIFKSYGYKVALFGFIGCDTSFLPETSSQLGFPGEWKLCNEWHASLPAAVRKLDPVIVMEASTPIRFGTAAYNARWVADMKLAFDELTKGAPRAVRVEIGTTPEHDVPADRCLAAHPTAVQDCTVDYASAKSRYQGVLLRDKLIAKDAGATLIPTYQWLCSKMRCSPVIGTYLAQLDMDHVSTPYAQYLTEVLQESLVAAGVLPKTP